MNYSLFSTCFSLLKLKGKKITVDVIITFFINILIFNPISQQTVDGTLHLPYPFPSLYYNPLLYMFVLSITFNFLFSFVFYIL